MEKMDNNIPDYSIREEFFNTISHGFGLLLSIPALVLLVVFASIYGDAWHIVSFSIYGTSLVLLYLASTLYHGVSNRVLKKKLNVLDHAAIYLLIAGTYTPFLLVILRGAWGWSLFGVIWGIAVIGIALKIFISGKLKIVSAITYVLMGWIVIIAIKPLINNLETGGLWWLFAGGICYTVGAIFYVWKKIPLNHGIFHLFVLGGSFAHWWAVFFYLV
jgi:hemolysin III